MATTFCVINVILIVLVLELDAVTPPPYFRDSLTPTAGENEDMEFRVAIDPGKMECFYQDAKKDHTLEVTYTVIEMNSKFQWLSPSGKSDLTIDFSVVGPKQIVLSLEKHQNGGSHVFDVKEDGTYKICLDNSYSSVSSKLVDLEVYLFSENDDDRWKGIEETYTFAPEIKYQESIESIRSSVNRVRDNLIKVVHSQDERRAIEKRDRSIAELNFEFINRFSIISILVFMTVAITQLVVIRSLFEDKSYLRDMIRKVEKMSGSGFR